MNGWQIIRQAKWLLEEAVWPGGEGVFKGVLATAATDRETLGLLGAPYCLLNLDSAAVDGNSHAYYEQTMVAAVGVVVEGGQFGEEALIGGSRHVGALGSAGRGLLEVEEVFLDTVGRMTGADGVKAVCDWKSAAGAAVIQGLGYVVQRTYRISLRTSLARYYHPPQDLVKSGTTVSWRLPPARFDRLKIILRRLSGATAPASPTAGTGVTLGSDLATSVVNSTSGQHTYAIFAAYDETHAGTPATPERYSDAASTIPGTTLTVS